MTTPSGLLLNLQHTIPDNFRRAGPLATFGTVRGKLVVDGFEIIFTGYKFVAEPTLSGW